MRCSCGVEVRRLYMPQHLDSLVHHHARRLLALRDRGCMTLQEMADRIGTTRQRISQIFKMLDDNFDGYARYRICTLRKKQIATLKAFLHGERFELLRSFRSEVEALGLPFAPVQFTSGKIDPTKAMIGSRLCVIRQSGWTTRGLVAFRGKSKTNKTDGYFRLRGYDGEIPVDFVAVNADEYGWFIVPSDIAPKRATYLVLGRDYYDIGWGGSVDISNLQSAKRHHNWLQYLNRWELLQEK